MPKKRARPRAARKAPARSTGPFTVGLMALHDRAFFERLVSNPRQALVDMVNQGKLTLTNADIDTVVKLVEKKPRVPLGEALNTWDRWNATGQVPRPREDWGPTLGKLLVR